MVSTTIYGTVSSTRRIRNSYAGNPRHELVLVLENGAPRTVRTAADHSFVYGPMPAAGDAVLLELNGRGTVVGWAALEITPGGAL